MNCQNLPNFSAEKELSTNQIDGILRCARYAFGPNKLHYCGPDNTREIFSYIQKGVSDPGLEALLKDFRTLYPYLWHIAEANKIRYPFNNRVVEAYWIGNGLLETIEKKQFYRHILDGQNIKKRVTSKDFNYITDKIRQGAVPHHSFHVLNIWKRTGHFNRDHTLESLDNCLITWGKIKKIDGPFIIVETEPLLCANNKLFLGTPIFKKITRRLESDYDIEQIKIGDIISMHWGMPCEIITLQQTLMLKKYTLRHIELANQTI